METNKKMTAKEFWNHILAGLSIGIVVALVPGALLGELAKALLPYFSGAQYIIDITSLAIRMLPMVIGITIAMQFKFTPIQTSSVGIATVVGSGVAISGEKGAFIFAGTGDVINAGLTAAFAAALVLLIGTRLKAYTILLVPTIVITVAGIAGIITLPYVKLITSFVGEIISNFTTLQPILMGSLTAISFALLIVSPISTVGVATAIALAGIGSGAANLGIVAAGFGLAIAGWKANSAGTSVAHFLGSPKMQMVNFMKRPVMILPIVCNAAILGALAGIFNIQGTPMSAGFGFSGLIGPINALNLMENGWSATNLLLVGTIFIILPIALGFAFNYIFSKVTKKVAPEDYKLKFE
ncbi:PTS sugar transporter subunit IIC [Mesobacillus subterraneus]|uniref:PTS transporter subunit IIC n=1 Tax=Mesobacillus subterraneus TaxID=285983 RepID=UPI00273D567F|nr:PTS sugar transporter subunit IIC [Mesobacillus subterraneus]WLR55401.1 PTS sugar transporter subunit IIC [Mesobacillus subterraneus]